MDVYFGHEANLVALSSRGPEDVTTRLLEALKVFDRLYRRAMNERMKLEMAESEERIEQERRKAVQKARQGRP